MLPLFSAILYQRILPVFQFPVGSLPSKLPLIPKFRAPSVSCLCILHCYGSHCFSVLQAFTYSLPCLDEVLQLSVHPDHRHPFASTLFGFPQHPLFPRPFIESFRYITVPRTYSPSLGFTTLLFVNSTGLGYSVGGWRISAVVNSLV